MDRLDIVLFEKGFSKSRSNSKDLIKNGLVSVNGKVCQKPSFVVSDEDDIKVSESANLFVGRGGLKLSKAIEEFSVNLKDMVCLDIGASTGGFTDCMLKNGAKKVYAVDVGEGQLDISLCDDERVVNLEKTNIKDIPLGYFNDSIDFISIDVSFISLKQVLPKASELLSDNGEVIALIKPQFEAGKKNLNKNGVVKDVKTHKVVLNDIVSFSENYFSVCGLTFSPIARKDGNIEYLIHLKKGGNSIIKDVSDVVDKAFKEVIFDK